MFVWLVNTHVNNVLFQIPPFPNMSSIVKLIIDKKTEHLRELVMNQKSKKESKKNLHSKKYSNRNYNNQYKKTYNNVYEKTCQFQNNFNKNNNNLRSYNYINTKPLNLPKSKGFVTKELHCYIENLCSDSQVKFNAFITYVI